MTKRCLIINADDFGLSDSVNSAIMHLFKEKRITSATIMAPAPKAEDAIGEAKKNNIPIGVHLTINSDWEENRWQSLSPNAASLTDEKGMLSDTKLLAKQAKGRDVTTELEAQVQFIRDSGCIIDHADNHCGTLYGINKRLFFINAFKLCRKYNLPFRFPKSSRFLKEQFNNNVPSYIYAAHAVIKKLAALMDVNLIDDMITCPYKIKDIPSYDDLRDYYLKQVENCREGITEMFLHPAYYDEQLSAISPEWKKRELEMEFLLSDELFKLIERENISLVSWKDAPFK